MRKLQMLVVAGLVSLGTAVAVGQFYDGPFGPPPRYAFPGEAMPMHMGDFSGEVIVVPHSGNDDQQVVSALVRPQVRRLGDRQYLTGRDLSAEGQGRGADVEVTLWILLERTSELYEYKSVEEARKVWKLAEPQAADEQATR